MKDKNLEQAIKYCSGALTEYQAGRYHGAIAFALLSLQKLSDFRHNPTVMPNIDQVSAIHGYARQIQAGAYDKLGFHEIASLCAQKTLPDLKELKHDALMAEITERKRARKTENKTLSYSSSTEFCFFGNQSESDTVPKTDHSKKPKISV